MFRRDRVGASLTAIPPDARLGAGRTPHAAEPVEAGG